MGPWQLQRRTSLVVKEPIGVVGAITPWNYPLHQIVAKVVPALIAGNTVVLKPTEIAPLTAQILAEVAAEAGVPAGAFNVVHGTGPVVGEAIAGHPDVDMISFTGSTRAGKRVSVVAADTVKRVALELGLGGGAYVRPTIFANVDPNAVIAQEEIFGPVLSVIPYADEEQAVEIANSTIYGLAGALGRYGLEEFVETKSIQR